MNLFVYTFKFGTLMADRGVPISAGIKCSEDMVKGDGALIKLDILYVLIDGKVITLPIDDHILCGLLNSGKGTRID